MLLFEVMRSVAIETGELVSDPEGGIVGERSEELVCFGKRRLEGGESAKSLVADIWISTGNKFTPESLVKVTEAFEAPEGVNAEAVRAFGISDDGHEFGDEVLNLAFCDLMPGGPPFPEVCGSEVFQELGVG